MTIDERRQQILDIINQEGNVRASDLAKRFQVTSETIRRDLLYLNNQHLVQKGHGMAKSITESSEAPLDFRLRENSAAKRAIAKKAMEYLENCSVVFIDAGSTLLELAGLLHLLPQIVIITNSFSNAQVLQETENTVYFLGGEINKVTQATNGFWTSNELDSLRIDIAFLGTSGFQAHDGPCTKILADAQLKQKVVKNSNRVIVLADQTKFVSNSIMQYASWSEVDLLISDWNVTPEQGKAVKDHVKLVLAEPCYGA